MMEKSDLEQLSNRELSDRIRELEEVRDDRDTCDLTPAAQDRLKQLYGEFNRRSTEREYLRALDYFSLF